MHEPSDELYVDFYEATVAGPAHCELCGERPGEVAHHGQWCCPRCADLEDELEEDAA